MVITILILSFIAWLIKQNHKEKIVGTCTTCEIISSSDDISKKFYDVLANEIMIIRYKLAIIEKNQGQHELHHLYPNFIIHQLMTQPYVKQYAWGFYYIEKNENEQSEFFDVYFSIGKFFGSEDFISKDDLFTSQQLIDIYEEPKNKKRPLKQGMNVNIVLFNRKISNPESSSYKNLNSTILSVTENKVTLEIDLSRDKLNGSRGASKDLSSDKTIRTVTLLSGQNLFSE